MDLVDSLDMQTVCPEGSDVGDHLGPVILTFFRNSICFMCFWFGFEILRLVYKKAIKRSGILHRFQKCEKVLCLAKGK